jgi:threonine/homoserine/homoserine lactone efflux protein
MGRRAALGTSLGVCAGLAVWTLAAAVGVASVVRASAVAFIALKLIGAAYLVWLGLQALRAAGHAAARAADTLQRPRVRAALHRATGVVLIAIGYASRLSIDDDATRVAITVVWSGPPCSSRTTKPVA